MKIAAVALVLLSAAVGVSAQPCTIGHPPGSSLLFPYFEVDIATQSGITTLLSINNESNQAHLSRVVVWSDWAIPVLAFDVYLEPFDVQTLNVRDLIDGNLPATSGASIGSFEFCTDPLYRPVYDTPAFPADQAAQLRSYLLGVAGSLDPGHCVGQNHGDTLARGYVTVDAVDECSGLEVRHGTPITFTPANKDYPYFGNPGSQRIAIEANVLWGDMFYVDPAGNSAQGIEAVPLRSDESRFAGPNVHTFYGRYSDFDGRDKRYPLPSIWATRFLNGGVFSGGTDLIVWRDTKSETTTPPNCGFQPAWAPLATSYLTARNEEATIVYSSDLNDPNPPFPLATQRISLSSLPLGTPFGRIQIGFGLNANPTVEATQAWVIPVMTASGRFSLDFNATPVNDGCSLTP